MESKIVPAADKTLKIIEFLSADPCFAYGVSEIAKALAYNKGTVYTILQTLIENQWVEKEPYNNKYFLSNKLSCLSAKYEKNNRLITDFLLVGNEMENQCGELINLHFLRGNTSAVLVARILSGAHSLRVDFPVGTRIPVLPSSAGKCMISELDDESLKQIFRQSNNEYTQSTIRSQEDFLDEMHRVCRQGYAINRAEYEAGIFSVGAPVRNSLNNVVAAINIVVPQARFSDDRKPELIRIVREGAERLSVMRGWKRGGNCN